MQDTIKITYGGGQNKPFHYIRLGALLKYIQDNLMYIVQIDDNNSSPLLKFDFEVETNLMFIENLQVSVDPNICLVNRTIEDFQKNSYSFTSQGNQQAEPFESSLFTEHNCYGQIMNIYVHMKWILLELDQLKDANTGKVVLIDFLNSILSSINSALGGINNLEATVDETINTVIIRDKNSLPNMDLVISTLNQFYVDQKINKKLSNESTFFDLYGYSTEEYTSTPVYNKAGHASFIKDFSFTTEITPQLSTMLTVGATANSEVVGENSTAFSRFNAGLTDRFKKNISEPDSSPISQELLKQIFPKYLPINPNQEQINDLNEEQKALVGKYKSTYSRYLRYLIELAGDNPKYNSEEAETYKSAVVNFTTYLQQIRQIALKKANLKSKLPPTFLPGTGFIPFNMSLTMDGMSGMKIYNKLNINTKYLPTNYPDIAEFLIKNITHKIENNKWYTTLESIVTIKGQYKDKNGNIIPPKEGENTPTNPSPNTPPVGNRDNCTIKTIPPNKIYTTYFQVYNFLKPKGYSKASIAGILGNLQSESALNLNAFNSAEGGCGAYGLAQWRGDRQTNLYNYAKSINKPIDSNEAQLGFLYKEIETDSNVKKIKLSNDPKESSFIFSSKFERFLNASNRSNPEVIKRQNLSVQIYEKLKQFS